MASSVEKKKIKWDFVVFLVFCEAPVLLFSNRDGRIGLAVGKQNGENQAIPSRGQIPIEPYPGKRRFISHQFGTSLFAAFFLLLNKTLQLIAADKGILRKIRHLIRVTISYQIQ